LITYYFINWNRPISDNDCVLILINNRTLHLALFLYSFRETRISRCRII